MNDRSIYSPSARLISRAVHRNQEAVVMDIDDEINRLKAALNEVLATKDKVLSQCAFELVELEKERDEARAALDRSAAWVREKREYDQQGMGANIPKPSTLATQVVDQTDDEWLSAIGRMWLNLTGQPWETRDGETREEGLKANITALFQVIEDRTKERNEAQAKCAEMRASLEAVLEVADLIDDETGHQSEHIKHALSSDCGKGWKSPEEYGALEAKCADRDTILNGLSKSVTALCLAIDPTSMHGPETEKIIAFLKHERLEQEAKCAALWVALEKSRCSCYTVGTDGTDGGCPTTIKCAKCDALERFPDCGKGFVLVKELVPTIGLLDRILSLAADSGLKEIAAERYRLAKLVEYGRAHETPN